MMMPMMVVVMMTLFCSLTDTTQRSIQEDSHLHFRLYIFVFSDPGAI
jgi:hypothetical protein